MPEPQQVENLTAESWNPAGGARESSAEARIEPGQRVEQPADLIYDLRSGGSGAGSYCADVGALAARFVAEAEGRAAAFLDGYAKYLDSELREPARSRDEYAVELLTLGMTLRLYAQAARRTPRVVVALARALLWLRHGSQRIKPAADFARAILFRPFRPRGEDSAARRAETLRTLPRLIAWMMATGEFEQEAARLGNWLAYLRTAPKAAATDCLRISLELFDWFDRESGAVLGRLTEGVPLFLAGEYARRGAREDQLFCGRSRVEYHLGMVVAEIMNQGLRPQFDRTPRKAVLVPACMRGAHAATCRAQARGVDIRCAGCDPECAVFRITRRMRQQRVPVYIVPHATGFSRWLERWQKEHDVGVVAVACLLNILPGGYEMRARGIASQCVPLDYPGCEKHWGRVGLSTGVNEDRLVQIATGAAR